MKKINYILTIILALISINTFGQAGTYYSKQGDEIIKIVITMQGGTATFTRETVTSGAMQASYYDLTEGREQQPGYNYWLIPFENLDPIREVGGGTLCCSCGDGSGCNTSCVPDKRGDCTFCSQGSCTNNCVGYVCRSDGHRIIALGAVQLFAKVVTTE